MRGYQHDRPEVAPEETASSLRSRPGLLVTLEDPPLGGPVAGIAAGLAALEAEGLAPDDPWVLLLSVDLAQPREVVAAVLAADPGTSDGVCLSDGAFPQYLAARYRREALHRALGAVEARNCSVKRLMVPLDLTFVVVSELVSADLDTPADLTRHHPMG
ncbi:MAG: NTP transferase domain-containing protein [Micropruina sp.]|nr:NTP transferase domain-containing protein [Micropruina sp.]